MATVGKLTLSLPPSKGNARNSEGAFYTLKNGDILFIYSKFIGDDSGDDGYSAIAQRISKDQGDTWSDDTILFRTEDHQAKNIMSVSMLTMQNGDIGLFYVVRMGMHDTRLHLRRSADQGKSWGEATPCIPAPGYYVTNNDRVIRLKSGRILVPANLHRMKDFDEKTLHSFDGRGIPIMFMSDDDGVTWREGMSYCMATLPHTRTLFQESGVIEKKNGTVYQWMRTDQGRQYEAISADGGENWTTPVPSRFTAPPSPLSMKRFPGSDKLLAVWNPIPNYNGRELTKAGWGRTPLVAATSDDDGKTWTDYVLLEDDPQAGFCYIAIHFTTDEHVLFSYCAGGPDDGMCLQKAVIRKVALKDLP